MSILQSPPGEIGTGHIHIPADHKANYTSRRTLEWNRRSTYRLLQFWWPFQWLRRGSRSFKLNELSPSSDSHQQGGLPTQQPVTVALIMDCQTITIHAGKCYKALINSEAAVSLIRFSTYQLIDDSFKTPIQSTTTTLKNSRQISIDGFRNDNTSSQDSRFQIHSQFHYLQQTIRHWNNIWHWCPKEIFTIICLGQGKNCYIQKDGRFLTHTRNCKQKAKIEIVKSTLKIPPIHNSAVPIKIKGHSITGHIAYFISNQDSTKGQNPNINIVNGIHIIKGKTPVNILVSNYANKCITFNKGEYVGHLEPTIEDIDEEKNLHFWANPDAMTTNSIHNPKNDVRTNGIRHLWATMP